MPNEGLVIVFPPRAAAGSLVVGVPESRMPEMDALQAERRNRTWRVRGVVSDHVSLAGDLQNALLRRPWNLIALNQSPLAIYLHHGGANAVYYDLVADHEGHLAFIEVRVETELPSNAFLHARKPLNELLDAMAHNKPQSPLVLQRLELVAPTD